MIEPIQMWCFVCEQCAEVNVMKVIGSTADIRYSVELCGHCGANNKVKLPE